MSNLNLGLTSSQDGIVEGKCVWELALGGRTGQGTCGFTLLFLRPPTGKTESSGTKKENTAHSRAMSHCCAWSEPQGRLVRLLRKGAPDGSGDHEPQGHHNCRFRTRQPGQGPWRLCQCQHSSIILASTRTALGARPSGRWLPSPQNEEL